jgi:hypothetical protein
MADVKKCANPVCSCTTKEKFCSRQLRSEVRPSLHVSVGTLAAKERSHKLIDLGPAT